jgi:hypothetical protein
MNRAATLLSLALLAMSSSPSRAALPPDASERGAIVPQRATVRGRVVWAARGELIVQFRPGLNAAEQRACAARLGTRLVHISPYVGVALVRLAAGDELGPAAERLTADPLVLDARPNAITAAAQTYDPYSAPLLDYQTQFWAQRTFNAWQIATGLGASVKVAVLDSGVSPLEALPRLEAGANMLGGTSTEDDNGHGTLMASLIAGAGATDGMAPMATIVPVKVLDANKNGTELALVEGLYYAASVPGVRVINMSLTFPPGYMPSRMLTEAVAFVASKNILMVGAAGNDGAALIGYPARFPDVISVGAVRSAIDPKTGSASAFKRASYSNGGVDVDIFTVGGDLDQDLDKNGFPDGILAQGVATPDSPAGVYLVAGTSGAAAQVSGALALLLDTGASPQGARYRLQYNSRYLGTGVSALDDRGLLDAEAILPGRERSGFKTEDADVPTFANIAPVFVRSNGRTKLLVVCELSGADGSYHNGESVAVALGGDVDEALTLTCQSHGLCHGLTRVLPDAVELVTVEVIGLLDYGSKATRMPVAASRYDRLSYQLLSNLGAGLDARGVVFRHAVADWATLIADEHWTDDTPLETFVMRPIGEGTASLPLVIAMQEPALSTYGLLKDTLVFGTRGTGLASSAIVLDRALFDPSLWGQWNLQPLQVRHLMSGSGLASSALVGKDVKWPHGFFFRGDAPAVLVMSQGTGLASSALVWDVGLLAPSLMSGASIAPWADLPPGSGGATSTLVADWSPTAVGELGASWEAMVAAFPGGTATTADALAQQMATPYFAEAMVGLTGEGAGPGSFGDSTFPFNNGCMGPTNGCGVCGYVPNEVCDGVDNDCDGKTDEGVSNACGGCGPVPVEVCDGKDNDCDGLTDEGVSNACGGCGPTPVEVCDGLDNDCDGLTDEDVTNACGGCGPVPAEVCDGLDNDCDGLVDEEVLNACGGCGPVPVEVCDGLDNDCDGQVDEHVTNACGGCGPVPVEVCDGLDNDCDGQVDEGVTNACGGCGPVGDEVCDGFDNDCDGQVDEDVTNACGGCGPVGDEVCDGFDNDCDGQVDEDVTNACGGCGPVGDEVCDGFDNDCDGQVDEGVTNACGGCGAVPVEVCDGLDNNCDGQTDEGLLNACGGCGEPAAEVCDGLDNNCDGQTDEGLLNACGGCGPVPAEVCDGLDNNCDGQVDEGLRNACGGCGPVPTESCNGVDDDCDGETDEDFHTGAACTATVGLCELDGVFACDADAVAAFCKAPTEISETCFETETGADPTPEPRPSGASSSHAAVPWSKPSSEAAGPSAMEASQGQGCAGGGSPSLPAGAALLVLLALALRGRPSLRGQG